MSIFPNEHLPINFSDLDMRYISTCDCAFGPDSDLEKAKKEFEDIAKSSKYLVSSVGEISKKFPFLCFNISALGLFQKGDVSEYFEGTRHPSHNVQLLRQYKALQKVKLPDHLKESLTDHLDHCMIKVVEVSGEEGALFSFKRQSSVKLEDRFGVVKNDGFYFVHAPQNGVYIPVRALNQDSPKDVRLLRTFQSVVGISPLSLNCVFQTP